MTDQPTEDREPTKDEPALTGGVFRRLSANSASVGKSFSVMEEIFAPSKHEVRIELEAQRLVGEPAPAPTDPPQIQPPAAGAGNGRFRGRIVIRPQPSDLGVHSVWGVHSVET